MWSGSYQFAAPSRQPPISPVFPCLPEGLGWKIKADGQHLRETRYAGCHVRVVVSEVCMPGKRFQDAYAFFILDPQRFITGAHRSLIPSVAGVTFSAFRPGN